ncbi:MAG: GIY-YIG nuclease family protein [Candidatus Bathyarchaeota archaeon]|nr:GIY-YIG nuclease family protein [Candidatus Bathyarchaeota archaeon]
MSTLKGIYVLVIEIDKPIEIKIGKLGTRTFQKGIYAYVGSAQNNLEQRVKRHLSKEKRLFWHIDYLLNDEAAKVTKVHYLEKGKADECKIAQLISENALSIEGFGCSDCNCKSHLFHAESFDFLGMFMQQWTMQSIECELAEALSEMQDALEALQKQGFDLT